MTHLSLRVSAYFLIVIMPSSVPVSIAVGICWNSHFAMRLRIPDVTYMISRIATRPTVSTRGMSRCASVPISESAIRARIWFSISEGKNCMIRESVWTLPEVWSVENTRCHVSASERAISIVSASRISPIMMMSASSRIADRIALRNDAVSRPTSRWEMRDFLLWKIYSIGSSIVITCSLRNSLIASIIDAIVVDFPLPVGPVTRKSPCFAWRTFERLFGSPSSTRFLICSGILRSAIAIRPIYI